MNIQAKTTEFAAVKERQQIARGSVCIRSVHNDPAGHSSWSYPKTIGVEGIAVFHRHIWKQLSFPDDEKVYAHFMALSDNSLRSRFGAAVTPAWLTRYVAGFFKRQGQILGALEEGKLIALGELRPSISGEIDVCELGLSISSSKQGQGLGKELLNRLSTLAADQGYRKLELFVDTRNSRMKALCNSMGADWSRYKSEMCANINLA